MILLNPPEGLLPKGSRPVFEAKIELCCLGSLKSSLFFLTSIEPIEICVATSPFPPTVYLPFLNRGLADPNGQPFFYLASTYSGSGSNTSSQVALALPES